VTDFWSGVKQQSLAGISVITVASAVGGIGYLIHTVPRKLDEVLINQERFTQRMIVMEQRVEDLRHRVLRLELTDE
jgi:hypothetical protein